MIRGWLALALTETAAGLAGTALIWWELGWRVALGAFLLTLAANARDERLWRLRSAVAESVRRSRWLGTLR